MPALAVGCLFSDGETACSATDPVCSPAAALLYTAPASIAETTGLGGETLTLANQLGARVSITGDGRASLPGTADSGWSAAQQPVGLNCDVNQALLSDGVEGVRILCRLTLINGAAAETVLGQPNFTSSGVATTASSLDAPSAAAIGPTGVAVADSNNHRVVYWSGVPTANGAAADLVLGQTDFVSSGTGLTQTGMNLPSGVFLDASRLLVGDASNRRVLVFSAPPASNGAAASQVVGQVDFTSNSALCSQNLPGTTRQPFIAGDYWMLADPTCHRVLIWTTPPDGNGDPADLVLGQNNFSNPAPNDDNQDGAPDAGPSARVFASPSAVWSDGERLLVQDDGNNRVLLYNSMPSQNFQAADVVLGQAGFTTATVGSGQSGLSSASGLASNGVQIFITDRSSNRIMIWDSFPTTNGAPADRVLGQADFASTAPATSQTGLQTPRGLSVYGSRLVVADTANNRVLLFRGP